MQFKKIYLYLRGMIKKFDRYIKRHEKGFYSIFFVCFFVLFVMYIYKQKIFFFLFLNYNLNFLYILFFVVSLLLLLRQTALKNIGRGEFWTFCGVMLLVLVFLFDNYSFKNQLFNEEQNKKNLINLTNSYNCYIATSTIDRFNYGPKIDSPYIDNYITEVYENNLDVLYKIYSVEKMKFFLPILSEMQSSNSLSMVSEKFITEGLNGSDEYVKKAATADIITKWQVVSIAENVYNFLCK